MNSDLYSADPNYLRQVQYRTADNLNARIQIHKRFSTSSQTWEDFIFEHLPDLSGKRLLALGCGNATQWRANKQRFAPDASIVLTDLSEGMLAEARTDLEGDKRFTLRCMDASRLEFADESFDFVTANHMLYHVPDIAQVLSEVTRVLKPYGAMMAATNGANYMADLDLLLTEFWPAYGGLHTMSLKFNLENGAEQLGQWFGKVEKKLYTGDLWVTEASPLVDYVYSTPRVQQLIPQDQREHLRAFFQARIEKSGGILIRKETGIFLASQPKKV
jgi:ubiquinone/menaquinone biosynthesis C-methylase UbiE